MTASPAPPPASVARGLAVTLGAQLLVALGTFWLLHLVAVELGTRAFAEYALVRQGISLLFPVVTVGLVGGLPRYLAMRAVAGRPPDEAYLLAASAISGLVTALTAALALALPEPTARLLFDDPAATDLVPPFAGLLVATAVFHLAYGWFRGRERLDLGNLLQLVAVGIVPPLVLVAAPDIGVRGLVAATAIVLGGLSLGSIAAALGRGAGAAIRARARAAGATLFDYGWRRVPGELAHVARYALPLVLAAHAATFADVAALAAAMQVMLIQATLLNPVGVVLLPALARRWAEDPGGTRLDVARLTQLAVHLGLFSLAQYALFADVFIRDWVGEGFGRSGAIVTIVALSAPFGVYALMLRSSLDAVAVTSYGSRTNLAGLALFLVAVAAGLAAGVGDPGEWIAWSFTAGAAAQGLLILFYVHRVFGLRAGDYALAPAVAMALVTTGVAVLARPAVADVDGIAGLLVLAVLQLALAAGFAAGLWRLRTPAARWLAGRYGVTKG